VQWSLNALCKNTAIVHAAWDGPISKRSQLKRARTLLNWVGMCARQV
jgi:hypothetical protein